MGVVFCREIFKGRTSGAQLDGLKYSRKHRRVYHVQMNSVNDGPVLARRAWDPGTPETRIPSVWDLHPDDPNAFVTNVDCSPIEDEPMLFEVTVDYSTDSTKRPEESPLLEPTEYEWGTFAQSFILEEDRSDPPKVVANSAAEPFDPPIEVEMHGMSFRITRNEAGNIWGPQAGENFNAYADTVNKAQFLFALPGYARMADIRALARHMPPNIDYWRVSYEILIGRRKWQRLVLDRGVYELRMVNGVLTRVQIKDPLTEAPITQPVYLDGTGKPLGVGKPAVYLEFKVYDEANWDPLKLLG